MISPSHFLSPMYNRKHFLPNESLYHLVPNLNVLLHFQCCAVYNNLCYSAPLCQSCLLTVSNLLVPYRGKGFTGLGGKISQERQWLCVHKKDPRSVLYPWLRYFCIIYIHHKVPQKHTTGVIHVSPFKDQLYYIYTVVCYTYISYLLHGALLATSIERDKRFIDINLFVISQYTTNYKNVSNENLSSYNWTICNAKNEIK